MSASGIGVWGVNNFIQGRNKTDPDDPQPTLTASPKNEQPIDPLAKYLTTERARKQRLLARQQQLGINENFYVNLVNQVFLEKNPTLQGRTLTDETSDHSLREQSDTTAKELLEKMALLSTDARRRLGTYSKADRERWKVRANSLKVSSRVLYDLGDAPFFLQFPGQKGKEFINQPIGQIWHGFVADKLKAIIAKTALRAISFASGATGKRISGSLEPAEDKVFIAQLEQDQLIEVNLDGSTNIWVSIYSLTGNYKLLEYYTKLSWSGELAESGYYEFVIVSRGSSSLSYQFSVEAESQTPTSTETASPSPTPTATVSPDPTPTSTTSPDPGNLPDGTNPDETDNS